MPNTSKKHNPVWSVARANGDIVFGSFQMVEQIVKEKQALLFVWPDEGDFNEDDDFVFNEEHGPPKFEVYEPLLIDLTSANMLLQVHKAISEPNKAKMVEWLQKDRAHFGRMLEIAYGAPLRGRK